MYKIMELTKTSNCDVDKCFSMLVRLFTNSTSSTIYLSLKWLGGSILKGHTREIFTFFESQVVGASTALSAPYDVTPMELGHEKNTPARVHLNGTIKSGFHHTKCPRKERFLKCLELFNCPLIFLVFCFSKIWTNWAEAATNCYYT